MAINTNFLTSANANFLVRCRGVYDNYVKQQGFQVDNAFGFGDRTVGETRAGVDGKLSGGYVFNEAQFTAFYEANSPSISMMDNCYADIQNNQETRVFDFIVEIPSVKKRYSFSGFLVSVPGGISAQKMLAGVQYVFNVDEFVAEDIN
jgi:hypothetical protein